MNGSWKLLILDPRFEIDVIVEDLTILAALAVWDEMARCGVRWRPNDRALSKVLKSLIYRSVFEARKHHQVKKADIDAHASSKGGSHSARSHRAFKPLSTAYRAEKP